VAVPSEKEKKKKVRKGVLRLQERKEWNGRTSHLSHLLKVVPTARAKKSLLNKEDEL
jgi:hypothetical protein